ncbi:MAG: adenosylcobalamin-dependent ribonucleoside-diphosphate reductase, partial [Woeseiaceae bacterium]|nr:adenosylcobalamin-dependent ribonucleoside-diphosphate reductase [Woeseiaceae bacterium]
MALTALADTVWQAKYRYAGPGTAETGIADSVRRICRAVARAEREPARREPEFAGILSGLHFLPGGRIWAGAGTDREVTLFNCFVSGPVHDSMDAILHSLRETAITLQQGGGIGLDFSTLRPAGWTARRTGQIASGPIPFMYVWDALCRTLLSTGARRGAMMGTLRCDHPDIEAFIDAKRDSAALTNFNLSVLVTDRFMQAVADDADWPLDYPGESDSGQPDSGNPATAARVSPRLSARVLWRHIAASAHAGAEPGLLFVDTINRNNNLYWCETISATNPCGEIPLPAYGACNLGSLNLPLFVRSPFGRSPGFDWDRFGDVARMAVRFLDDVIDVSGFPLEQQAQCARATRRIGIGITGLADSLVMLGLRYDSNEGRDFASRILRELRDSAYAASIQLAREKGSFPLFDRERYLEAPFVKRLPGTLRDGIAEHGIRNSHLLAIAPAGTISLLAGNVSGGIEPIFALETVRDVRGSDLELHPIEARDYAYDRWL